MTDKQIAETWNAWRDVVAMEHPPAEGELADGLQAWLDDAVPEDLWRAVRIVYLAGKLGKLP